MSMGPVEVIVLAFPGNKFNGSIVPELARLVDDRTITIIDGLFAVKDTDGTCTFVEIDELGDADSEATKLARLVDRLDELISDEDVEELMADIEPGSSGAILVFEHTWAKGLKDAIVSSGGVLTGQIRVPPEVVEEVRSALAEAL